MSDYEKRKMEKQFQNEALELLDRERIANQLQAEMEKQGVEVADLCRRNPKLQNTQVKNYTSKKKDINASTLNHIADSLGGQIVFVPPGRRRRRK